MVFERQKEAFFAQSAQKQLVAASGNRITVALKLFQKILRCKTNVWCILTKGEEGFKNLKHVPFLTVLGPTFSGMGMVPPQPIIL